jgi:hypothetical protein
LSDGVIRILIVDDESSVCDALAIGLASQAVWSHRFFRKAFRSESNPDDDFAGSCGAQE